jgi:hypothetical protein
MAKSQSKHEYEPRKALDALIERVERVNRELALLIRRNIDAGTVESVSEPGKKRKRSFMKIRSYTDQEALRIAVGTLRAYFVELPACIDSANAARQALQAHLRRGVYQN